MKPRLLIVGIACITAAVVFRQAFLASNGAPPPTSPPIVVRHPHRAQPSIPERNGPPPSPSRTAPPLRPRPTFAPVEIDPAVAARTGPAYDQQEADGAYGFDLRYRTVSDVFDRLVKGGLPAGLDSLGTVEDYNRIRVKGTPAAVEAIRRRIGTIDGTTSGVRVRFHVRLQDIIATDAEMTRAGFPGHELEIGVNQMEAPKVTQEIQTAIRKGIFHATPGASLTIDDGQEVSVSQQRPVIRKDPKYWSPRAIPAFIQFKLTLKPQLEEPGRVRFGVGASTKALATEDEPGDAFDEGISGANAWSGDGETMLLAAIMEERYTHKSVKTKGYESEGIWHLVIGTTTFDNPAGRRSAPKPHQNAERDHASVSITDLEAPAASWRAAGADPDADHPTIPKYNFGGMRDAKGASEVASVDGPVDIYPGVTTPVVQAFTLAPGQSPVFAVMKFSGHRINGSKYTVDIDLKDVLPVGAHGPRPPLLQRHFKGEMDDMFPDLVVLASRRVPGQPNDVRRLTFAVFTVPYAG